MAHTLPYFGSVHITSSDCKEDLLSLLLPRLYRSSLSRLVLSTCVPTFLGTHSTGISTCYPSTTSFDFAQPCVFVKQLPGPILCASSHPEDPLSRSYRVSLPSSLTVNHSSALVYSTRLRVSVCGTGTTRIKFSGFSREYVYVHYWIVPKDAPYSQVRLFLRICLQESTSTPFNGLFRQSAALSLLRLHVTP